VAVSTPPPPVDFGGQQFPPETEVVDLVNVRPVSLDPLADLSDLEVLRLHHTDPHRAPGGHPLDLAALRNCARLAVVDVPRQAVRSLSGLEGHAQLRTVDVSGTRVADVGPLDGLPNLAVLRLRHTRVADLSPLATVSSLEELDVAHTLVEDISPLRGLPRLTVLDLRATGVTDLSVLTDLPVLRRVVLQRLDVDSSTIDRLRAARPALDVVT
jgi:Leucine-rich repeat (LRR) protein